MVGAIGNDLKMDYTAVGQTVHLASRMEQMATPGSVMITKDALQLAEGFVQVKSLGPIRVKGMGCCLQTMSGAVLQYDIVSGFQWRRQVGFAKHLPQIYFCGPAQL